MARETGYRIGRHLLILLAVTAISYNQIYMGFIGYHEVLGNNMYFFTFLILITYLILGYFNIYVLIPRYLLKEKYATYFIVFFISILFFMILHYGVEYGGFKYYSLQPGIYSYFHDAGSPFWLEFASSFLVDSIAILGVSFTILLKHWLINDSQVNEWETVHMQSEVEKLKEQVNPDFLFSILHKVGDIAEEEQAKASDILMELSEVLRYELYDCNRQEVLLNSEIGFIRNYLQLEQLCYGKMDFEVAVEGDTNSVLVPPLLFLPIVQYAVKEEQKKESYFHLILRFQVSDDSISLFCSCPDANLNDTGLTNIRLRLHKLYNERSVLRVTEGEDPMLHLRINF